MSAIGILSKLSPEIVNKVLVSGSCSGVSRETILFIKQLQFAAEIYENERNIWQASKDLQTRILAEHGVRLDLRTCQSRIYAAISYFSINNNVAIKVWETDFANKYEELAQKAEKADDLKTAKACMDASRECRIKASEAAEKDAVWAPIFLISNEVTPEMLGFEKKNLKEIAHKNNDGFYINLIDSLPIEQEEKQRLMHDAGIEEAEIIEEVSDGE